jgi:DNA-binding transcriptional ArsR family regulator
MNLSRQNRSTSRSRAALDTHQLEAVAGLFSTLAETSRLRTLQVLQQGPLNMGEVVEQTGFKQANVSKQLGILLAAGVIARRQEGNKVIYAIALPMVFDLCNVVCQGSPSKPPNMPKCWAPE